MQVPEAEDREPVEQGGKAEGEVVDGGRGSERPLLDTAGDDGGEFLAPEGVQFLQCWGYNSDGELGNGTTTSSDVPVTVHSITNAKAVIRDTNGEGAGGSYCALLSTSHVDCWGYNNDGELGNGTTTTFTAPVSVKNITTAGAVVGGDYGFCALLSSHHVDCWGYGAYGELGNGSFPTNSDVPVAVRKITNAVTLNAGNYSLCSLLSTGHVDCWGYNGYGELGNGSTTNSDVPVAVAS